MRLHYTYNTSRKTNLFAPKHLSELGEAKRLYSCPTFFALVKKPLIKYQTAKLLRHPELCVYEISNHFRQADDFSSRTSFATFGKYDLWLLLFVPSPK